MTVHADDNFCESCGTRLKSNVDHSFLLRLRNEAADRRRKIKRKNAWTCFGYSVMGMGWGIALTMVAFR